MKKEKDVSNVQKIHILIVKEVHNVEIAHKEHIQKLDIQNVSNVHLDIIHQEKEKDVFNVIKDHIQMN